nr:MAG TPA: hypothetical protein [Caudoviricetes sp.]
MLPVPPSPRGSIPRRATSFIIHNYLRLLPARESRHSHTATESAKRCIFTRKGRAAHLVNR